MRAHTASCPLTRAGCNPPRRPQPPAPSARETSSVPAPHRPPCCSIASSGTLDFYVSRDGLGSALTFDFNQTSSGGSCSTCPVGYVKCGTRCIAETTCCRTDPSVGMPCPAPELCAADGDAQCACGSGILCGTLCIAAGTCCNTDSSVGVQCSAPAICPSDGSQCHTPACECRQPVFTLCPGRFRAWTRHAAPPGCMPPNQPCSLLAPPAAHAATCDVLPVTFAVENVFGCQTLDLYSRTGCWQPAAANPATLTAWAPTASSIFRAVAPSSRAFVDLAVKVRQSWAPLTHA